MAGDRYFPPRIVVVWCDTAACGPPQLNLAEADETVGKNRSLRIAVMLVGAGLTMAGGCTNFVANSRNADGVTLFQRGQYQDALQKFQEATYADPNNADGYYNLGATYHRLGRLRPAISPTAWPGPRPAIASAWSEIRIIATATAGLRCC